MIEGGIEFVWYFRYIDEDSDDDMEFSVSRIRAEESRRYYIFYIYSSRIGREEDDREEYLEYQRLKKKQRL